MERFVGILTETDIRTEIARPNLPGTLFEGLKAKKGFDAGIVSLAAVAHDEPDKKVPAFRTEVENYMVLKAAIKKAGYEMLPAD